MKIIHLFFLLNLSLFASYTTMFKYFQKAQYQKVIKEAQHSSKEYHNPLLHLLWAKSEAILGHKNQAMSAYERVLILDEENKEAKNSLQQIYKNTLLSTNKQKNIQKDAFNIRTSLVIGHNSNINITTSTQEMNNYYDVSSAKGTLWSNFTSNNTHIDYTYSFEKWFVKSNINIFNQSNFNAHNYDIFIGTTQIGLGYTSNEFNFFLPINYDNFHYYAQHLMNRYQFTPTLTVPLDKNILLNLNAIYKNNDFKMKNYQNYNANTVGLGSGITILINDSLLHLGIDYKKRKASTRTSTKFVNADFISTNINILHPLTNHINIKTDYLFRKGFYSENIGTPKNLDKKERDDTFHRISFQLSYDFNRKTTLYIQDTYSKNSTNYTPTRYTQNVISLGLNILY